MRVLHLTDRLTDRGGAYRHLLALTRALAERGHEVHIAAGHDAVGDEVVRAAVHRCPGLESRTAHAVDLDSVVSRLAPDVVHVHTVVNPVALRQAAGHGAVFTVQDHRAFCPGRGKWTAGGEACRSAMSPAACAGCFDDRAYHEEMDGLTQARLAALHGATVITLSEYMREELVHAGLSPGSVHAVPPFVDFAAAPALTEEPGPPCVLFVGRVVEAKGVLDGVEAWRRSGVRLPLVVAGTGPLRERVAAAGAAVLGWIPHAELPALYRRARAVLMPSRWQEPFGIVGLEALHFGVPVVAWDSGGIREWHPGPLPAWGDVDGLAAALRQAVTSRARPAGAFDRERLMDRLERLYSTQTPSPGAATH